MKVILIVILVGILFFRMLGFFARMLSGSQATNRTHQRGFSNQHQKYSAPHNGSQQKDGSVHIDYMPGKDSKSSDRFRGGEYVDYEEIE